MPRTYAPPGATDDTAWRRMVGALPYGYSLHYIARREGVPTLFLEVASDAVAPSGYDLDASLVIDRSARLGCLVDGDSAIAKGYDLEVRLLQSTLVDAYFTRPQRITALTTALTAAATTVVVESTRAFTGMTECYIGTSCITLGTAVDTQWTGCTRTTYGRARSYPVGTLVTDSPSTWQGAQWDLFAVLMDPSGAYVQTANILDSAVMVWSGYGATRPERDGTEWVLMVRDQIRRLADPIGVAASGTVVWTDDDDALVRVPVAMTYTAKCDLQPTSNVILDVNVRPFAAYADGDYARASKLRDDIAAAVDAAATDAQITGIVWNKRPLDLTRNVWELNVQFAPAGTDVQFNLLTSHAANTGGLFVPFNGISEASAVNGAAASELRPLRLMQPLTIGGVSLAVILDEGDPAAIPTAGMVVLEAGGRVDYARYTALEVDDSDAGKVHLVLDTADSINGEELMAVLSGERSSVSVRFLWADSGQASDILRRVITSSGDSVNGVWDTLPRGQGLGIGMVADDSFDDVFAGAFDDLDFAIYTDSGSSVADVFGGVLRLSRTALVTRRSDDGTSIDITAVDVGTVDTGDAVALIDDDLLVSMRGRRPVRVRSVYTAPQVIECKARTAPVDDIPAGESAITFRDPHLVDWTSDKWDLDIYGLSRDDLQAVGWGWALSWFRAGETRQVVEIDVPPWVDAQVGQVVELDITDPTLWDYATGVTGFAGFARVLGEQMNLTTGVTTLTVACDGIYTAGPMCPSLPVVAVNGGATTPTSIDVDDAYYSLLVAAQDGQASWKLLAYKPGEDGGRAEYTCSTLAIVGGVCRVTVTAYPASPAVTLTTSYRVTWPASDDATANQGRYLHTDDGRQWA